MALVTEETTCLSKPGRMVVVVCFITRLTFSPGFVYLMGMEEKDIVLRTLCGSNMLLKYSLVSIYLKLPAADAELDFPPPANDQSLPKCRSNHLLVSFLRVRSSRLRSRGLLVKASVRSASSVGRNFFFMEFRCCCTLSSPKMSAHLSIDTFCGLTTWVSLEVIWGP